MSSVLIPKAVTTVPPLVSITQPHLVKVHFGQGAESLSITENTQETNTAIFFLAKEPTSREFIELTSVVDRPIVFSILLRILAIISQSNGIVEYLHASNIPWMSAKELKLTTNC